MTRCTALTTKLLPYGTDSTAEISLYTGIDDTEDWALSGNLHIGSRIAGDYMRFGETL